MRLSFWDEEPELDVYELLSWDLPGHTARRAVANRLPTGAGNSIPARVVRRDNRRKG